MTSKPQSTPAAVPCELSEVLFTNLVRSLIRSHKFDHKANPSVVILPKLESVDGVKVQYGK